MSRVLLRHSFSDTDPFPSSFRFFWLFIHLTVFRSKRHVKITFCDSTMTLNFFLGIHEKIDFTPRWFPLLLLEVEFLISLSFLSRLLDFGPNLNCPLISHLTHTHTHIPCIQWSWAPSLPALCNAPTLLRYVNDSGHQRAQYMHTHDHYTSVRIEKGLELSVSSFLLRTEQQTNSTDVLWLQHQSKRSRPEPSMENTQVVL